MIDRLIDWILPCVILMALLAIPAATIFVASALFDSYKSAKSPVITLQKRDWSCTRIQRVESTIYVRSGSVMLPVTTANSDCQQWSKQK